MIRYWRWIVPVLVVFVATEVIAGFAAYGSNTWNWNHTEVLDGWAAVREVCLVFIPITFALVVLGAALLALAIRWARKDRP